MKLRVQIDSQTYEVEVGDLNARPVLATIDGFFPPVPSESIVIAVAALYDAAARPAYAAWMQISS